MEDRQNLYDMSRRFRKNCRICGEHIDREEAFYSDGKTSVHLCCYFEFQAEEVEPNECAV